MLVFMLDVHKKSCNNDQFRRVENAVPLLLVLLLMMMRHPLWKKWYHDSDDYEYSGKQSMWMSFLLKQIYIS